MPTVTLTRDVFRYAELSSEARDEVRLNNYAFQEWETVGCDSRIRGVLMEHGIPGNLDNVDVHFSLGYCQGDGVCFDLDRLEAGVDGPADHQDWVDCWAGFPERTLGADLDPERLHFKIEQRGQHFTSDVTAFYDCICECNDRWGTSQHCCENDWDAECCDPRCPTSTEVETIAQNAKELVYGICTKAYSDISHWGLDDRLDELAVFFEDQWFYEDGSSAPDPDS